MKQWVAHTVNDLPFIAKELIESLGNRKILAFDGAMGAGKTTFIQSILRAMGIPDPDGSPTYGLVSSYESPYFGKVFHFDVYRLDSVEEALGIGMEEMLYSDAWCLIEWAEKVEALLPDETVWIRIAVNDEGERLFSLDDPSSSGQL
jgi:tRNA threonylcarbamoyladenosine biosynthesis protein TsaE